MSLKDTIRGAREEAAANSIINSRNGADKSAEAADAAAPSTNAQGFTRRSAARSKPAREAAAGVRVVSSSGKVKKKSNMTKAEQKEERNRQREDEDRRYNVREMLLEEDEEFKRVNKVWHRLLIVGGVIIFVALTLYGLVNTQANPENGALLATAALVTMLVAYVIMGVALIYNWRMVRPLRIEYDHRVASMSDKKVRQMAERGSSKKK